MRWRSWSWTATGGRGPSSPPATRISTCGGRTPAAEAATSVPRTGRTPSDLLPHPPERVLGFSFEQDWAALDRHAFTTLVRNHGAWFESDAHADSPYAGMYSEFYLWRKPTGTLTLDGLLPAGPDARRRLSDRQVEVVYRHLTATTTPTPGVVVLHSYGGRSTPSPRTPPWSLGRTPTTRPVGPRVLQGRPRRHGRGERRIVHQHAGRRSRRPGYTDNYPRLQRVKAAYDPMDVFRHRLPIRGA
ncbi:BBE domain-containing protein [Nonomuraea longicatena]|uniref:Berberine/berberine-like domain-containing protein n=1 Tax=Nonomuraea longicatena TaxID=83682 RepID=A0ABP4A3A6_9ACTN